MKYNEKRSVVDQNSSYVYIYIDKYMCVYIERGNFVSLQETGGGPTTMIWMNEWVIWSGTWETTHLSMDGSYLVHDMEFLFSKHSVSSDLKESGAVYGSSLVTPRTRNKVTSSRIGNTTPINSIKRADTATAFTSSSTSLVDMQCM